MKKKTLRREVNFKPPKEQTESTRPHRYAEPGFYRLCSERDHHDQIPADPRGKFPEDVLKKDGSASLIAGNTMGSPEMARFVGLVRLCEASAHFSNRISCCISLPGPAESFCPSQGCALTQWPRSQRRTQLGRRKSAPRQRSPMQSN